MKKLNENPLLTQIHFWFANCNNNLFSCDYKQIYFVIKQERAGLSAFSGLAQNSIYVAYIKSGFLRK